MNTIYRSKYKTTFITGLTIIVSSGFFNEIQAECMVDKPGSAIQQTQFIIHPNEIKKLEGKMDFYWNQLLTPGDFKKTPAPEKTCRLDFPDSWNGKIINGEKLPGKGHATYRTIIYMDTVCPMAIQIKDYCNAYRLWINGKLIAHGGIPGTSKAKTVPAKINTIAMFLPKKGANELVLQTANYREEYGGFREAFLIGNKSDIVERATTQQIIDAFVLGIILMMALYHLGLYSLDKKRISLLWFGLLALFIFLRQALLSDIKVFDPLIQNHVVLYLKIAISLVYIISLIFFLFIDSVYPEWLGKRIITIYLYFITGCVLFTMFFPIYTVSVGAHYLQVVVITGFVYLFFRTIKSFFSKSSYRWLVSVGILIFLLSVLFEILIFNRIFYFEYTLHYGLVGFILFQSFALSVDSSRTNKQNLSLTKKLENYNRNLKSMVQAKSDELIQTKERELLSALMQKTSTDKILKQIEGELIKISPVKSEDKYIHSELLKTIRLSLNTNEGDKYLMHFEKIHPGFFEYLKLVHPSLTQHETRICAYIRINLSNREIAEFLHVESESVRKAKTRMRKKMGLISDKDIYDYLIKI